MSCLFDCCSVACGCRDQCGRNNLCSRSRICVWSLVCWSCCVPFCRPFFLLLHSPASFALSLGVGSECFSPHHAVGCKVLPGLGVDVKCFHAFLADILVALLWAAFGSYSRCQLSIENVFWDAAILHAADVPEPTQPALSEQDEHAWKVNWGQDLGCWTLCLARICQGYGGCFSGGRNRVFSPVWHMWSMSRCRTSVC